MRSEFQRGRSPSSMPKSRHYKLPQRVSCGRRAAVAVRLSYSSLVANKPACRPNWSVRTSRDSNTWLGREQPRNVVVRVRVPPGGDRCERGEHGWHSDMTPRCPGPEGGQQVDGPIGTDAPDVRRGSRYSAGIGGSVAGAGSAPAGGRGRQHRIRSVQVSERHSAVSGVVRRRVRRSPPQRCRRLPGAGGSRCSAQAADVFLPGCGSARPIA